MNTNKSSVIILGILLGLSLSQLAFSAPDWQKDLSELDSHPAGEIKWYRVITHIHTLFSHDACTNILGSQSKKIKNTCKKDFTAALCRNHVDAVFITDHGKNMGMTDFNELLSPESNDDRLIENDVIYEVIHRCADGHRVHLYPGSENKLMSLGLKQHIDQLEGTASIYESYRSFTKEAAQGYRNKGALFAIAHSEEWEASHIKAMAPDLMEVYNLHANIVEPIEKKAVFDILSLVTKSSAFFVFPWVEPDLLFLNFFKENAKALNNWAAVNFNSSSDQLLIPGIAGSDVHQNWLSFKMYDGERMDGYRRSVRWFSNAVPIEGEFTREKVMNALKSGQSQVVFEVFGTPQGHRAHIESAGKIYQSGSNVSLKNGKANFIVVAPDITDWDSSLPEPKISIRVLRASATGWDIVAQENSLLAKYEITEPGVYRAEIRVKPRHLKPYLFGLGGLIKDRPWVYFNPIRVTP